MLEIVKIKDIIKGRIPRWHIDTRSRLNEYKDKVELIKIEEIYMSLDGRVIMVVPDEYKVNKKETE